MEKGILKNKVKISQVRHQNNIFFYFQLFNRKTHYILQTHDLVRFKIN